MNSLRTLVERRLSLMSKSGNDYIYCCPKCNDTTGHLWINYDRNVFHCFKCDYAGRSIVSLLRELGIDFRFDYESLESSYASQLDDVFSLESKPKEKREVPYSRNTKLIDEYYHQHIKPLSSVARQYLNQRGFTNLTIDRLHIMEGINRSGEDINVRGNTYKGRDYSGRVLVPSYSKELGITYYVARDYTGTKSNKYLNPPKELAYSSEDVWNLNNVETDSVVICEGVFSAIAVISALGKNTAVATYGKSIASKSNTDNPYISVTSQGDKLLSKQFQYYYVFYDKDALESALHTCQYLYERGASVRLVTIPYEKYGDHADANNMTREEIISCIIHAVEYNNFTSIEDLLHES